jgi:hypothetical protein
MRLLFILNTPAIAGWTIMPLASVALVGDVCQWGLSLDPENCLRGQ